MLRIARLLLLTSLFSTFSTELLIAQHQVQTATNDKSATADELSLRATVGEYFDAYAKKDLARLQGLWITGSAELASHNKELQQLFAKTTNFELRNLAIRKISIDGQKATVRVAFELSALEVKTTNPATGFRKLNRTLRCEKQGTAWKLAGEAAAEEELATALAAAKTEGERSALLSANEDLLTGDLRKVLVARGERLRLQGNYAESLSTFQILQSAAERVSDNAGVAQSLNGIGLARRWQGNYKEALEYFQKSLDLSEKISDKGGIARALNNIGLIHYLQDRYPIALDFFRRSMKLNEELDDRSGIALNLYNIANVFRFQSEVDQAFSNYERSLAIREELGDKEGIAANLQHLGGIEVGRGNYDLAHSYLEKSLALRQELGDKAGIAQTLVLLGTLSRLRGDYGRSVEYSMKGLSLSVEIGDKEQTATTLNAIALNYFFQGSYDLALAYSQKSLHLGEALGDKIKVANALNNIANVNKAQGNYALALENYKKSLTIGEALGSNSRIASTLHNIGNVLAKQSNYEGALESFRKSLALKESTREKASIPSTLNSIGWAQEKLGQHVEALAAVERSAALAREIGSLEQLMWARAIAGSIYRTLAQPARALEAYEEAISLVESQRANVGGAEQEQQRYFENKVAIYQEIVALLIAENRDAEALTYAERAKGRVLLDVLQSGRVNITKAMTTGEQEQEHLLSSKLISLNTMFSREALRRQPEQQRLDDLKAQLESVRLAREAFQNDLYAAHPELKTQRGQIQALTVQQAAGLLPNDGCALLEYVVADDNVYIFLLTRGEQSTADVDLKTYTVPIKQRELIEKTERFRQRLANQDPEYFASARELYNLLIGPVRAQLQGKNMLVIVPDNLLWELPFQALQTSERRYLIEDYAISYAPSLTVLREIVKAQRKTPRYSSTTQGTLLAVGNPALGVQTQARAQTVLIGEKLAPLPDAEDQVNRLGHLYGAARSKVYTGSQAREDLVKAAAGKYRILQLAAHGILNNASPMYSSVVLAPAADGSGEDGLLEAWEIMRLDLKADLVVLSACETARGRVGPGEGVIGLVWAFFVAGSPTTIVSQWSVESRSTTELMLSFHRNLNPASDNLHGAITRAEALRQAQLKLLRIRRYQHPFFWAGFVVVGDGF